MARTPGTATRLTGAVGATDGWGVNPSGRVPANGSAPAVGSHAVPNGASEVRAWSRLGTVGQLSTSLVTPSRSASARGPSEGSPSQESGRPSPSVSGPPATQPSGSETRKPAAAPTVPAASVTYTVCSPGANHEGSVTSVVAAPSGPAAHVPMTVGMLCTVTEPWLPGGMWTTRSVAAEPAGTGAAGCSASPAPAGCSTALGTPGTDPW